MFATFMDVRSKAASKLTADFLVWFNSRSPNGSELLLGFDAVEYYDFKAKSESQQARLILRIRKYLQSFRGKRLAVKSLEFFIDSGRACGNRS